MKTRGSQWFTFLLATADHCGCATSPRIAGGQLPAADASIALLADGGPVLRVLRPGG